MDRFVEAFMTGARFYAVDTSSKTLTITDKKNNMVNFRTSMVIFKSMLHITLRKLIK